MNTKRPVNLNLLTIHFPITAIASIIHRITGVVLFVGMGLLLWALQISLRSEAGFMQIQNLLSHWCAKWVLWGIVSALLYHFVAGIKHLLMDAGIGESLFGGRLASMLTLIISVVLVVLAGVWIW